MPADISIAGQFFIFFSMELGIYKLPILLLSDSIKIGLLFKKAINLWESLRLIAPPGPLQLAGGTNSKTINLLKSHDGLAGIAFGGVARKLLKPLIFEAQSQKKFLIDWKEGWEIAVKQAQELINPWLYH